MQFSFCMCTCVSLSGGCFWIMKGRVLREQQALNVAVWPLNTHQSTHRPWPPRVPWDQLLLRPFLVTKERGGGDHLLLVSENHFTAALLCHASSSHEFYTSLSVEVARMSAITENDLRDFSSLGCLIAERVWLHFIVEYQHPEYYSHWDRAFPHFSWDPHLNNNVFKGIDFSVQFFVPCRTCCGMQSDLCRDCDS